jgi:hypothetical protein
MPNYYALMLNFTGAPSEYHPKIEAAINPVTTDWLRLGNYQYLVATHLTSEQLYQLVKPNLPDGAYIVVVAVNIADRSGWASQITIDWFKKQPI